MTVSKPFPPRMRDIQEPFDVGISVVPRTIEKVKPKKRIETQPKIRANNQRHNFPFQSMQCFKIEDISAEFPTSLSTRGNSYYLRLDPRVIRFWNLNPGDVLYVKLLKVRRLKKQEEDDM